MQRVTRAQLPTPHKSGYHKGAGKAPARALLRRRSSSGFFPSFASGTHMDSPLSRSPGRKELSED